MDKLSIKIKIADREYPMKVLAKEEESIRNAGRLINQKIKDYREKFGIDDNQDLLAMVAFDSLIDKMSTDGESEHHDHVIVEKIQSLNNQVTQAL